MFAYVCCVKSIKLCFCCVESINLCLLCREHQTMFAVLRASNYVCCVESIKLCLLCQEHQTMFLLCREHQTMFAVSRASNYVCCVESIKLCLLCQEHQTIFVRVQGIDCALAKNIELSLGFRVRSVRLQGRDSVCSIKSMKLVCTCTGYLLGVLMSFIQKHLLLLESWCRGCFCCLCLTMLSRLLPASCAILFCCLCYAMLCLTMLSRLLPVPYYAIPLAACALLCYPVCYPASQISDSVASAGPQSVSAAAAAATDATARKTEAEVDDTAPTAPAGAGAQGVIDSSLHGKSAVTHWQVLQVGRRVRGNQKWNVGGQSAWQKCNYALASAASGMGSAREAEEETVVVNLHGKSAITHWQVLQVGWRVRGKQKRNGGGRSALQKCNHALANAAGGMGSDREAEEETVVVQLCYIIFKVLNGHFVCMPLPATHMATSPPSLYTHPNSTVCVKHRP